MLLMVIYYTSSVINDWCLSYYNGLLIIWHYLLYTTFKYVLSFIPLKMAAFVNKSAYERKSAMESSYEN